MTSTTGKSAARRGRSPRVVPPRCATQRVRRRWTSDTDATVNMRFVEREVRNGGNKRGGRSVDYGEQVLMKVCEALRHPPALPRKQNKQAVIL